MSVSRDTEVFINSCFVSWSLQRNRINRMYAYIERKWFSEGIGSWDGGALVNPEFNREDRLKAQERVAVWGSLLQNQKEPVFQMKPESCLLANCLCFGGRGQSLCYSGLQLIGWYTLYSCLECFFPFLSPLHLPNPLETQLKCHFPLLLSLLGSFPLSILFVINCSVCPLPTHNLETLSILLAPHQLCLGQEIGTFLVWLG